MSYFFWIALKQFVSCDKLIIMETTISIYLKSGDVYEYKVNSPDKAREHMYQIWATGYRSNNGKEFVWYGPHWIDKIKCIPAPSTNYPDELRGT